MKTFKLKCIVCEKELEQNDCNSNSSPFDFGYGSMHDLTTFQICLCDICFLRKIINGTIKKHVREVGKSLSKKEAKKMLKELELTHKEEFRKEKLKKLLGEE